MPAAKTSTDGAARSADPRRLVAVRLDRTTHRRLQYLLIEEDTTFQSYLTRLILADLERRDRLAQRRGKNSRGGSRQARA
jgi:hypothetical protein